MKRNLLIVAMAFSCSAVAQTTITKSYNDPVVGDVLNNVVVNGAINNTPTGANVNYDNSTVTAGAASVNTYSAPTTAELTNFPLATIKHSDGNGITVYYKQSADKLEIVGIENTAGTLKFTNAGTAITYPTSYGTTTTDQAQGSLVASGTTAYFKGNIVSNADATGTLIIGTQTFNNVLRLKITQNYNIYLDSTMLFSVGTATNTSYMYFDAAHKFPLLNYAEASINVPVASINQSTSGAQAQSVVFLSATDVAAKSKFTVYPNPVHDVLFVEGNIGNKANGVLYSIDGKRIQETAIVDGKIDTSNLSKGVYVLEIISGDGKVQRTKVIKH